MFRRVCAAAATVVALASSLLFATPDHPDPNRFSTILSNGRVDVLPGGKVVINFDATGEYRGLLTLNLSPEGGNVTGDWMLSVRSRSICFSSIKPG